MRSRLLLDDPEFQRAFLAVRYLSGSRDPAELLPFAAPSDSAGALLCRLQSEDRSERARALAQELEGLVHRLEARKIG